MDEASEDDGYHQGQRFLAEMLLQDGGQPEFFHLVQEEDNLAVGTPLFEEIILEVLDHDTVGVVEQGQDLSSIQKLS